MKYCIYDYDDKYYIIPTDRYNEFDDMMWERTEYGSAKAELGPPEWAIPAGSDLGCITFDDWEVI